MTKTTRGSSDRRRMTALEGEALVREWRESGLSLEEFGRRHQVGAGRIRYWARRLSPRPEQQSEPEPFVVMCAEGRGRAPVGEREGPKGDATIEIFVGENYFVRVPPREGVLGEILKALREVAA